MKIIVLVKQVYGEINRTPHSTKPSELQTHLINETDRNAIEEALRIREKHGGTVTALTMGPMNSQSTLREALAMGVDEAILLSDEFFEGSDSHATVTVLAAAVTKILDYDLILCGAYSDDLFALQVGPRLAEECNLPQITYATKITLEGRRVIVERDLENELQTIEGKLPCLIIVLSELNEPRVPSSEDRNAALNKDIIGWNATYLSLSEEELGFNGSLVDILRITEFAGKRKPVFLRGEIRDIVPKIVNVLEEEGVLREL